MTGLRLLLFNLATDADDPVLGFTTAWINALAEQCAYVDVLTMRAGRVEVSANVRVYSAGRERGYGDARRAVEFYRRLGRLLASRDYDACFAHMMPLFTVMAAPLLKMRRIPITLWFAHKAVTFKVWLAEKLADRVVTSTVSGFRLPSRKVIVVGQGIDVERFRPNATPRPAGKPYTILSASRIAPIKGLETLLEAARILADQVTEPFRVRIVGQAEPPDRAYALALQAQVRELGLESVVEFAGPLRFEAIHTEYQAAEVFVNPSKTGSADKTALEAMSCALPVATCNEAFNDMLAPWADLLLMPKDDPLALAERLRRLMQQPEAERAALGRQLRQIVVEHHSLQQLARRLVMEIFPGPVSV